MQLKPYSHRTRRSNTTQRFSSDAFINNKSLCFGLIPSVEFTILVMFYVEWIEPATSSENGLWYHSKNDLKVIYTLMAVPTSTPGAVWGSVSCQRTLQHADRGKWTSDVQITRHWLCPWATAAIKPCVAEADILNNMCFLGLYNNSNCPVPTLDTTPAVSVSPRSHTIVSPRRRCRRWPCFLMKRRSHSLLLIASGTLMDGCE